MKIRIEFTREEKNALVESVNFDEMEINDESTKVVGKFGQLTYDKDSHVELDLNNEMVISYAKIISKFVGLFKSVFETVAEFVEDWFEDAEVVTDEEEKEEVVE